MSFLWLIRYGLLPDNLPLPPAASTAAILLGSEVEITALAVAFAK
jgi:hypothetical protein